MHSEYNVKSFKMAFIIIRQLKESLFSQVLKVQNIQEIPPYFDSP
jgi:hypothetical protein